MINTNGKRDCKSSEGIKGPDIYYRFVVLPI
jgi:hypothetical protein